VDRPEGCAHRIRFPAGVFFRFFSSPSNLRYPSKFARWIDRDQCEGRRTGRFLLLGSATNALLQQTSESLAGRVAYLELAPFNLLEAGAKQQSNL
jgi:hypothetical protein